MGAERMTRRLRHRGLWPGDLVTTYVWHILAVAEDMADLVQVARSIESLDAKRAVMKKALVDLKTFAELVDDLRTEIPGNRITLDDERKAAITDALSAFAQLLEPNRKMLIRIRDNLGAHRRGLPTSREKNNPRRRMDQSPCGVITASAKEREHASGFSVNHHSAEIQSVRSLGGQRLPTRKESTVNAKGIDTD